MGKAIVKFFKNVLYWVIANVILFIPHLFALFGVAFNDSGAVFDNFFQLLPPMLFCLGPFILGSVVLAILAKKYLKDFWLIPFCLLQWIEFLCWMMLYVNVYMP